MLDRIPDTFLLTLGDLVGWGCVCVMAGAVLLFIAAWLRRRGIGPVACLLGLHRWDYRGGNCKECGTPDNRD